MHPLLKRKHLPGAVVQLVRIPACHAVGREFESRPHRKKTSIWVSFLFGVDRRELSRGPRKNFILWGEEEARQLYKLRSNAVIDRRFRRRVSSAPQRLKFNKLRLRRVEKIVRKLRNRPKICPNDFHDCGSHLLFIGHLLTFTGTLHLLLYQ